MVMVFSIEYGFCCQLWIAWLLCTGGVTYLGHTLYSGEYCLVGLIVDIRMAVGLGSGLRLLTFSPWVG